MKKDDDLEWFSIGDDETPQDAPAQDGMEDDDFSYEDLEDGTQTDGYDDAPAPAPQRRQPKRQSPNRNRGRAPHKKKEKGGDGPLVPWFVHLIVLGVIVVILP